MRVLAHLSHCRRCLPTESDGGAGSCGARASHWCRPVMENPFGCRARCYKTVLSVFVSVCKPNSFRFRFKFRLIPFGSWLNTMAALPVIAI